mgnify:CR=1 FL=1
MSGVVPQIFVMYGPCVAGAAYTPVFVASEYLVNAAGVVAVKHDFWAALRPGTDWHIVFANVFGTSVDQFYADFEAYRRTL